MARFITFYPVSHETLSHVETESDRMHLSDRNAVMKLSLLHLSAPQCRHETISHASVSTAMTSWNYLSFICHHRNAVMKLCLMHLSAPQCRHKLCIMHLSAPQCRHETTSHASVSTAMPSWNYFWCICQHRNACHKRVIVTWVRDKCVVQEEFISDLVPHHKPAIIVDRGANHAGFTRSQFPCKTLKLVKPTRAKRS